MFEPARLIDRALFARNGDPMAVRWGIVVLLCSLLYRAAVGAEHEFRYKAADAKSVELMCEFNGWKGVPMTKGNDGIWAASVSLPAGKHAYKFLVNGTDWVFDPENPNRTNVDGIENSAIEIADSGNMASNAVNRIAQTSPNPTLPSHAVSTPIPGPATSLTTRAQLSPTPGEILIVEVPLSDKRRAEALKEESPKLAHARMALSVPQGFDPQGSWPILVICNTEAYSNIDSLRQFKEATNAEGWVVLAADAVESEKDKEGSPRWPCLAAAFDYLTAAWPKIASWPIACGGMSGGAKNSAFLAAELAREHHRIIGMLMMGCNQDMATAAYRKSAPPNFLTASVFLSSGKSDTIATPAQHEHVKRSLQGTGFRAVRLEHFDGAHDIYQPHITEALKWFTAQSSGATTAKSSPSSDFDKFFKKKQ